MYSFESHDEKKERWRKEHRELVESGKFDAIPQQPIKVGDMVAIRASNLIHQVYQVNEQEASVGYDSPNGEQVRKRIPLKDIRDGAGYQNAVLEQKGSGHLLETTVNGNVSRLWDKTKKN